MAVGTVLRTRPLQNVNKPGSRGDIRRRVSSPTDNQWVDKILDLAPHVEECRALGGQHPFMAVAKNDVRTQTLQIDRELAGRVRGINDR